MGHHSKRIRKVVVSFLARIARHGGSALNPTVKNMDLRDKDSLFPQTLVRQKLEIFFGRSGIGVVRVGSTPRQEI